MNSLWTCAEPEPCVHSGYLRQSYMQVHVRRYTSIGVGAPSLRPSSAIDPGSVPNLTLSHVVSCMNIG